VIPQSAILETPWALRCQDYLALCKPRIVAMLVFTAMVGMFLAVPGAVPTGPLVFGSLGIALAAAAAAVINHVVDRRIDAAMARTRRRPLPQGQVKTAAAILFAAVLGGLAMLILTLLVNPLTAVLTLVSLIGYGFVYSCYLKHATSQNIVIGGAAGAAPPVLGWTAVTGELSAFPLVLFLIIFVWTPPHFWSLAIYRRHEYALARIPMLPVTHGLACTRLHILLYTVLMVMVSLLPALALWSGPLYLAAAVMLGSYFLYLTVRMQFDHDDKLAHRTFLWSIAYLLLLFAALLLDHYLPRGMGLPY